MAFLLNFKYYLGLGAIIALLGWTSLHYRDNYIEAEKNLNDTIQAYETSINIIEKTSYQKGMSEASKKEFTNIKTKLDDAIKNRGKIDEKNTDTNYTIISF